MSVEMQQVKREIREPDARCSGERILKGLEARQAAWEDNGHLPIEQGGACRQALRCLGDLREARGPVEIAPALETDFAILDGTSDSVAVKLQFVHPLRARGSLLDERV
jgi:hypothetical protein